MARQPDIIAVDRPHGLPKLPFELRSIIYQDGPGEPGRSYWAANAWVSNAVAQIDNHTLASWVCRTLNAAVIAAAASSARIVLEESDDFTHSLEITSEPGEVTIRAIVDEDEQPTRRVELGFPADRAVEIAAAIIAASAPRVVKPVPWRAPA